MQTISKTVLDTIEQTRALFFKDCGFNCLDEKRKFINWYIENHSAPYEVLVSDLSNYYLHISKDRIIRYMKEN